MAVNPSDLVVQFASNILAERFVAEMHALIIEVEEAGGECMLSTNRMQCAS